MKKKLSIEERRQMARERRSKIMTLAHQLKDDEGLTLSNALKLAHMTAELLYWLRKGKVYFAYFKKTKEPPYYEGRPAIGTLCEKSSVFFKEYIDHNRSLNPHFDENSTHSENGYNGRISYWDIDRKGWRTCKVADLLGIYAVTIVINKFVKSR